MTDATTEMAPYAFVRKETLEQQPAPLSVAGPLAWVWDRVEVPGGTPTWIVSVDENPVLVSTGLDRWEASVLPQIELLVAKLRELR